MPPPGRRAVLIALTLTLVAVAGAACTGEEPDTRDTGGGVYPIGLLTPVTGADAARGKDAAQGARMAVELVNNVYADLPLPLAAGAGVRDGGRLELIVGDTEGSTVKVEDRAAELVNKGAVGIVLVDGPGVSEAAGRRTDPLNVALLDAQSAADSVADMNRSGHFRVAPSDRQQVEAIFALLRYQQQRREPANKITLILGGNDNVPADRLGTLVTEISASEGFDTGAPIPMGGTPDVERLMERVTTAKPNVVLVGIADARQAAVAAELAVKLRGITPVIAFGRGVNDLDAAKPSQDLLRTAAWSTDFALRQPVSKAIAGMYQQQFSAPMSAAAAEAFTATLALAMAIDRSDTATAAGVRAAVARLVIPATQMIMPWNGIRFDGNGGNELAVGVVEQRGAAGFLVVYPPELSASAIAWPG